MKIAAAQFDSVPGDVEGNVRAIATAVHTAAGQGARLVLFAELAVTGYGMELVARRPDLVLAVDDARLDPVREACRATGTVAVVNAVALREDGRAAISSLVLGPDGKQLARYDKRHLHGVERELFAAGERDGRFTVDGVRCALTVCYDNRFPEIAERAREDGCRLYLASSVLEEGNDSFDAVYPERARRNGMYVAMANQCGPSDLGPCPGRSGVWGPDGTPLASAGSAAPGLAVAELAV
ncbi:carbon-nitrogen hydrolase family protein [Streptomyces sp. NPDC057638]|uniref:carbon-nitrogen hydrolase family protein n=1 Tax=Streptomyces sp. NPDC057638 TaxID=3346190 RepID=UPI0036851457